MPWTLIPMRFVSSVTPLILAGGLGNRLRSVVADRPKVMAPVNDRPFLSYLLDQLIATGFRKVILCVGYKGNQIKETFGDSYKELIIQYSHEKEPLGTGGALRYALSMITTEHLLVMNGDSYVNANIADFLDWHIDKKSDASLLLVKVADISRFGQVEVGKDCCITHFEEKKVGSGPGLINAGIYIFEKSLLEAILLGKFFSLEREFLPAFIGKGLYGYSCDAKFIDIGTPESYFRAEGFFSRVYL